jgi:hypothetical protein
MRDIFIFNEIEAQGKIYILAGTLLGLNILLISYDYYRYWLQTISSPFCHQLKLACFLCRNAPTNKDKVAMLLQLIFLLYYCADERNYCTLGFLFIYICVVQPFVIRGPFSILQQTWRAASKIQEQ